MTGQQWSVFSLMEGEWVSEQATAGENTKVLSNGAVYDMDAKRIVANPGGGTSAITQANASAMATACWDAYRERAEIGAARGARRDSSLEAWEWIVERQTELAGDIDKGRSSTEAANFLDRALSARPERSSERAPGGSGNSITFSATIPEDLAMRLLAEIRSKQGEIATVIDVDTE